jgi:hypothetical protein
VDVSRLAAVGALIAASAGVAFAAQAAPRPKPKPPARPASPPPHYVALTVAWGGDTTLGSSYGLPPDRGRPELAAVASALRAADVATLNYEGTFGPGGASKCGGLKPKPHCFAFQAPPANARTLARAGVDVVNQANNHAWDFGALGWHATRDALHAVHVRSTGAPGEVALLRRHRVRIALVGFSTYPWSAPMADPAPLVAFAAREADVVIAFMHAGAEGADQVHVPRGGERDFGEDRGDSRAFAHAAIDAGADLVLGSGPHVLRGLERYRGRLIAYSLGNLAGWHNFGVGGRSRLSALLTVRVAPDGRFLSGDLTSLTLDAAGVPAPDPAHAAARFVAQLTASDFGGGGLKLSADGGLAPR